MIKKVIVFNYSRKIPFEETDRWFFEQHARLMKNLPYLIKYVSYRFLQLPRNDFFPSPQFNRIEELWWPDRESFRISQSSSEEKKVLSDLYDPARGPWIVDIKQLFLEKEINILNPEMSGSFQATMNELNGKPHIKSLWPLIYLPGKSIEERENWYLNHHTILAARNFNLIRYITCHSTDDYGDDYGVIRLSELCWRDWETMLNDFESKRGLEVLEDNKNENGKWRVITKTNFMEYPHVVGNEVVFI